MLWAATLKFYPKTIHRTVRNLYCSLMSDTTAIKVNNVSVTFGKKITALDDVSVNIPRGKITGLIGPSGAGKTTLMRCIVGRQRVKNGTITIGEKPAGSAALRSLLSYKTQEASAYGDLTVWQNLKYFATMMNVPKKSLEQEVSEVIKTIDLKAQTRQLVGNMSGGQKQRVSLAIALIGKPKIMILDEPTVGLDPVLRDSLWNMFRALAKKGTTLLVSSHVMDEAERCDDLILIRQGKIIAHDSPEAMRQKTHSNTVEESFLKLVRSAQA